MAKASRWLKQFGTFTADLRIQSKEELGGETAGVPLKLWESQRRFLRAVGEGLDSGVHIFNCLKSRQLGITTVSLAIDVFWLAMHKGIRGCLVTDDDKKREENRALIVSYVKSFPEGYFGDAFYITKNNRAALEFSNGSRLALLVAGTKKKAISWAEGSGYALAHLTEISAYGDVEGLKSLEEGFAQKNPHRLFMYESTAKGFNHWRTKWLRGLNDISESSFFIGWWANETNRIERRDPLFVQFGLHKPNAEEKELIEHVRILYSWNITPEQLAWIRWKESKAGSEQDLLDQNQPWTHEQAFVQTGYSFFATRQIGNDIKDIDDNPDRYVYQGYRYNVDGDFYNFKLMPLDPQVDSIDLVELKVWEEPVENGRYAIGFDPAYGRNEHKDGSAIVVLRCFADKVVQVAEYRSSNVEAKHAAWAAFHICAAYRDCMINVELTGPGRLIMAEFDHLRQFLGAEMNVQRTTERKWQDAAAQARWFLYHREDSFGSGFAANYEANFRTKQVMMYTMRGAYHSNEIVVRSKMLLKEMLNTIVNGDDIGAPDSDDENRKDDRVFALGLAVLAWTNWVRKEMLAQGQTYESVMALERGEVTVVTKSMNNLVLRFLARADEEIEPPPTWRQAYGVE
jgi:hypothetical protein